MKQTKYDDWGVCPKCGMLNDYKVKCSIDGYPCEVETECKGCGHQDYWAYGWYEPDIPSDQELDKTECKVYDVQPRI